MNAGSEAGEIAANGALPSGMAGPQPSRSKSRPKKGIVYDIIVYIHLSA